MPGIAAPSADEGAAPSWSERLLGWAERSHGHACALLLLLSLACFLPGFASLQPMDRDEPRFSQATKQMIESGDYVDIRFQDEARYKKPIGIHWLQVASVRAAEALGVPEARATIAVYRVPSLLGALAAVLLAYWAALAFGGRREAFLAAALVAASILLTVEARLAKTDAVLLACCTAAMGALARVWLARGLPRQPGATVAIFWAAIAAGILIKGPMVAMFAGLAAAGLSLRERSPRWLGALRPWAGVAAVLLAVSPWFLAIAWKSSGEFYRLAVGDDMLGKVATGQQNHFAPPGFYLVSFFATFWPGAVLAALAAPFAWRHRGDDAGAFALAWIVPAWLIFEAVPTKLPHYVLPLYPMIAIVAVAAIASGTHGRARRGTRLAYLAMPLVPVGITALIAGGAWILDAAVPVAALPVMLAACLVSGASWLFFARGEVTRAVLAGVAASVLLAAGVLGLAQPVLQSLKLSPRLAAAVRAAPCADPAVATLGYREPSLVLLVGTGVAMVESPEAAAAFLREPGCRVALVLGRYEAAFLVAAAVAPVPLARIAGFNINGGRRQEIGVWATARP